MLKTINPKGQVVIFHFAGILLFILLYVAWVYGYWLAEKNQIFAYCAKGHDILDVAWNPEIGCNPV